MINAKWDAADCSRRCLARPRIGQQSSGLTLLELVMVLVILAIVATVAIQSLQPRLASRRFSEATRLLEQVKTATVGPFGKFQVDSTPLISGFIADVGQLPQANNPAVQDDTSDSLAELWDDQSPIALSFPFQFRGGPKTPVDYSTVRLPCGWRGPYLSLPIGSQAVSDPWGKPLTIVEGPSGEAAEIQIVVPPTGGSSQATGGEVVLKTILTTGRVHVTGKVLVDNPENDTVLIALLTPDPKTSLTTLAVRSDEDKQFDSFAFSGVPVGLRALVVDFKGRRQIKYVQVPHSGLNVVIDLRN